MKIQLRCLMAKTTEFQNEKQIPDYERCLDGRDYPWSCVASVEARETASTVVSLFCLASIWFSQGPSGKLSVRT